MGILDDARQQAQQRNAAASRRAPKTQLDAQQEADYQQLVARLDPYIQRFRRAMKRRGHARLKLWQRMLHRYDYGQLGNQPEFKDFMSLRLIHGELYRQVQAGKKYLRVEYVGRLIIGLNTNEWWLRSKGPCTDCCWGVNEFNREKHVVIIAANDDTARGVVNQNGWFDQAMELLAICAEQLGIPDDELE